MYGLQDLIGEDAVNQALREVVQAYGDRGPPYPTSRVLLAALRRHTPERFQYYLTRPVRADHPVREPRGLGEDAASGPTASTRSPSSWRSRKLQADALGVEHEVPLHDWIPVGVLDAQGEALVLESAASSTGRRTTLTLVTDGLPARAGVDPLNELVDRVPEDNLMPVSVAR